MIGRVKRAASRLTRALASVPLKLVPASSRAQVLQTLSEDMISNIPTGSGCLKFYAPTNLLRFRAETLLSKEPDTIKWVEQFHRDAVFWDIGANVGVYSLYAATLKNATVLSFEPSAANFHVLTRNIQLNELSPRVTAYCIAFSDRNALGILNLASPEMGAALSRFGQLGEKSEYAMNAAYSAQGMLGMTVDDFIDQFTPPFPNYLKIDVDGLEMQILNGARKTLSDQRLGSLVTELSLTRETEKQEAFQLLEACGWRLASRGERQGSDSAQAANHFFERIARSA